MEMVVALLPDYFMLATAAAIVGMALWIALSHIAVAVRWLYTSFIS